MSISTAEAELVAASEAVRLLGLPAQEFWEVVLRRKVARDPHEDKAARIAIIRSGKNPATRHVSSTHRVQGSWLTEVFGRPQLDCVLPCQVTNGQAAEMFTTPFADPDKWRDDYAWVGLHRLPVFPTWLKTGLS